MLERVADAVMDAEYVLAGFRAENREDVLPPSLRNAVRDYLIRHPEVDGGVDVCVRDGRQPVVLRIVGDPEPHRAALARLYRGDRLVVERRPPRPAHSQAELNAIADRIVADEPELATAGLHRVWMARAPELGEVEVHVVGGRDERAAAEFFATRYGDAVTVWWQGPSRFREAPHPFGSWTSDGRRIRVFFALDPNGWQPGQVRVAETDELIVIALSCLDPVGLRTLIGGFHPQPADLELREPVGGRVVIDASVGAVRSSLAELRGRSDRRWPYPAGSDHRAPEGVPEPTDIFIEDLELGAHAYDVLKGSGVQFVDDVTLLSAEELAGLPKMNQKVLDEIVDALAAVGLSLTVVLKG